MMRYLGTNFIIILLINHNYILHDHFIFTLTNYTFNVVLLINKCKIYNNLLLNYSIIAQNQLH